MRVYWNWKFSVRILARRQTQRLSAYARHLAMMYSILNTHGLENCTSIFLVPNRLTKHLTNYKEIDMTGKMRLTIIVMTFAILGLTSMACNVEPGDGKVGNAVMKGYNGIRDTAAEVKDAVDTTGNSVELETHESPLPGLWELAEEIHSQDTD